MAIRLFAVLAGNETPAGVAAMLAWFREDPKRLPRVAQEPTASTGADKREAPTFVNLRSLDGTFEDTHHEDSGNASAAWKNAMALLRSAFSTPRGAWNAERDDDAEDDDKKTNAKRTRENDQQNAKSLEHFEAVLPKMLDSNSPAADPFLALTLTHFVADRIRPPSVKVRLWISQILPAITSLTGSAADQALASFLMYYGTDVAPNGAARARRALLVRGVELSELDPGIFVAILESRAQQVISRDGAVVLRSTSERIAGLPLYTAICSVDRAVLRGSAGDAAVDRNLGYEELRTHGVYVAVEFSPLTRPRQTLSRLPGTITGD
jgi:hypothetical protein